MLPILVLLLVLGHVCDVSAYADALAESPPATGGHHAADGPDDDQALSCDAVEAVSSPAAPQVAPALEIAAVPRLADDLPMGVVVRSPLPAPPGRARPPLFLLHASLLI
jgi:hypothetical protein